MSKLFKVLNEVRKDQEGATMVEYALLLGGISVVAIIAIAAIGTAVNTNFQTACHAISPATC